MNTVAPSEIAPANRIVSVAEMQTLERTSDAAGHSYAAMMERAGEQVAKHILASYGRVPTLVLAGPGNNGGDGLVCARTLHQASVPVRVYLWKRNTDPERDYEGHFGKVVALGVAATQAGADPQFDLLREWLECAVVVDALLGTGSNRPVEGELAALLSTVSSARARLRQPFAVVAVDCASGMDCDTGAVSPSTIRPDLTVTFAYAKHGHFKFPGAGYVGKLVVSDIGIEAQNAALPRVFVLDRAIVNGWLPRRPRHSHKGSFGKVMLAVGSESFPGAAYLSCAAAGRIGAGLVTGAVPRSVWPIVAARLPEPTWLPLPAHEDGLGVVGPAAAAAVAAAIGGYDALVLGCGLGNTPATRGFVEQLLGHALPPTLIDADGLNCLAQLDNWPMRLPAVCVLTPHPAEMARLCGLPVAEVVERRWDLALSKAAAWGCVVLVKGPYTVVAAPDGWLAVLPVATPALATAGTGDVLSGTIGGMLAQGLDLFRAACTGAWLHAQAGMRCEQMIGTAGVVASDVIAQLPAVLRAEQLPPG